MTTSLLGNHTRRLIDLPTDCILPNKNQPRTVFDPEALRELCVSIENIGIIQPLSVRYSGEGMYELIAGERRLRAAASLGMRHVPCIISDIDDSSSALIALVENLQRQDLNYFDQAQGLRTLMDISGMTQAEAAEKTGKTQSAVANKLRLLRLSPNVRTALLRANLSERHARALLALPDEELQLKAVAYAVKNSCTVAGFEKYIEGLKCPPKHTPRRLGFCRDLRLYSNTFNQTVKMMQDSGFHAEMTTENLDNCVKYTIIVHRSAPAGQSVPAPKT